MSGKIAVFIDRDGTLSEELGYINDVSEYRLLPRTPAAIKLLNDNNLLAVVVTNQAGVARGYFPEERVGQVHARMKELLAESGAKLDGVYYCPHHPTAGEPPYMMKCDCRKPEPGMIETAAADLDIDISKSYMIGDKFTDVQLAERVGCKGIFVMTGYGRGEWENAPEASRPKPALAAQDLLSAVQWILKDIQAKSIWGSAHRSE